MVGSAPAPIVTLAVPPSEIARPLGGMIDPFGSMVSVTPVLAGAMTPVVLAPEQVTVVLLAGALLVQAACAVPPIAASTSEELDSIAAVLTQRIRERTCMDK
jgi:hypothetical protein